MEKFISFVSSYLIVIVFLQAQDSLWLKKTEVLSTQSILFVKTDNIKLDSAQFKIPKYKQGFFCNFEDQLNRKKVPIDFSLGKSKY